MFIAEGHPQLVGNLGPELVVGIIALNDLVLAAERRHAFRKFRDRIHSRVMVLLGEGAYGSKERGQFELAAPERRSPYWHSRLDTARYHPISLWPSGLLSMLAVVLLSG
jgi:hypothetical protein